MNILSRFNIKEKKSLLSFRLLVAVLLCSSFLTLLASAFQLYFDYQKDVKAITVNIQFIQDSYLPAIISSVYTLNDEQVQTLLEGALNILDIEYLEIRDISDNLFKSAGNPAASKDVTKFFPLDYFTPSRKVISVGALIVSASLEGVYHRLWEKTYVILFSNMVKTFFASILILMIINHIVIRHLIRISNFTNELSMDKLDQKLILNRNVSESTHSDELEQLVQSINQMLANIKKGIDEIENLGQAYRESEEKHKEMIANISDVIAIMDSNGIIRYKSPNIEKWFGWNPENLIGTDGWATVHPNDLERIQKDFSTLIAKENCAKTVEYKYKCKDGSYKWIELTAVNLMKNPLVNGILMNYHDITERNQTIQALKEKTHDINERIKELKCLYTISTLSENRDILPDEFYQAIANTIPPAWQYPKITCAQIVINKNQYTTGNFKVSKWKQCSNIMAHGKRSGTVEVYYAEQMPGADEGPFLKEERDLINELAERISRFIEREQSKKRSKKLETQLRQSQKMEAIGTLAGGIAHDFNNILFPIIGYTEMLLLEDMPEGSPLRDSLDQIHMAGLRAKNLVKQILTFSRQASHELVRMKMQPAIKEALKLIRSTIPSTIDIKQDISNDCGIVKADPTQIHQIIMNLATNAYHAMEDTGGELKVSLKNIELGEDDIIAPNMTPGVYAYLSVSDTGMGMDKDLIKNIFDPFFTTKENGKGTGMGLSVVYGIVNSMGGVLQVYSEPGHGTEFKVYIPVEKSHFEKQDIQAEYPIVGGPEQILIVDDEVGIVKMEKLMLERLGYQVTTHTSSIEVLEVFRANPTKFDLVITDMTMPNMPGDKLSAELIKMRPDISILLCTGFSEIMSEEKATSLGIKGFLMKPIVMNAFAQKIREVLDENK